MKKTLLLIMVFLMLVAVSAARAADAGEFTVTSPMETAAVGFLFPNGVGNEGTVFAVGVAHTVLRVTHSDLPKIMLDVDGTLAQSINEANDTLGGIGIKLGYNAPRPSATGIMFVPSIGLTVLNDFAKFKKLNDILDHYSLAVYGSAVLYKW